MKNLIFLAIFLGLFGHKIIIPLNATVFDRSVDNIPDELFPLIFPITGQNFGNPCDQISLNAAQYNFNSMIPGLNPDLTWRNSSDLNTAVRQIFSNGSTSAFQVVCRARDGFESTLRTRGYYGSCLSRFFLMNQPGADWSTVMRYIMLYQHLDFICNQGFEQFAQQLTWGCMQFFLPDPANVACDTAFNQATMTGNFQTFCSVDVPVYMACKKTFWDSKCNPPIGFFACEEVRVGYAQECRGLRCLV